MNLALSLGWGGGGHQVSKTLITPQMVKKKFFGQE